MKLKELEKRLKNEPNNLGLRVQVAGLMREAGRSLEAVELYRSVALAYRDQGRTQQAIAVCRSILQIAPEDSACQGLLAMLQQRSRASQPPPAEPPRPQTQPQAVMRGSPMPPAPEVPSLRPQTTPPTSRPTQPGTPTARQMTPAPGRAPTTPTPQAPRTITNREQPPPPRQHDSRPSADPTRRSSFDQTPLPAPVPYHMVDPTSQPNKISAGDLNVPTPNPDEETRPEQEQSGLGRAARRITGLIHPRPGVPAEVDISAELDTRQRRKIADAELDKIAQPPPTIPIERVIDDMDDMPTPPPPDVDDIDLSTQRQRALPRGSEESLPLPPARRSTPSLPRIDPPSKPSSRPPPVVSIPPKTSSRPPGTIAIPPKPSTPSPPPLSPPPPGTQGAKLRPQPPPAPLPKIPRQRTSEEELTKPRGAGNKDDDD